jgi:WD40 repeat protein
MIPEAKIDHIGQSILVLAVLAALVPPVRAGDEAATPAVPKTAAILEVQLPQGATVLDKGKPTRQQRFTYRNLKPGKLYKDEVQVRYADGREIRRDYLFQAGWLVRLPLPAGGLPRPELVLQTGHAQRVSSVAFSPDGKQVLTGSGDGRAILWDAASGQQLRAFDGHTSGLFSVAFSPDGKQVLTGSGDGRAILWDAASGRQLRATGQGKGASSVAFSPDGKQILFGLVNQTALLWDVASGEKLRVFDSAKERTRPPRSRTKVASYQGVPILAEPRLGLSVAFSPDGKRALTGSDDDCAVILWDVASGQKLRAWEDRRGVSSVAFSPDGKHILTTGHGGRGPVLWDTASGQEIRAFTGHTNIVTSARFSPDGKQILSGSGDKTAILWDTASGRKLHAFAGHGYIVSSVAFSRDGKQVLTGTADKTAILWDARSGQKLRAFQGHTSTVNSVAFSPDVGQVVTGSARKKVIVWDGASGRQLRHFAGSEFKWESLRFAVTFSADGKQILTCADDLQRAILWDAVSGQQLRPFGGRSARVTSAAFSPDGKQILTGTGSYAEKSFDSVLWDVATGQKLHTLQGHSKHVVGVAFSWDGKQVLTGSPDGTAILWDAQSGRKVRTFQAHGILCVALSPDAKQILAGCVDGTAILLKAAGGQQPHIFRHGALVDAVAFSPDGRQVLTGSWDKTAVLWDSQTGQKLRALQGHTGPVKSVAFSPDGRHVLTGSGDGMARLWDLATGDELARLISMDQGKEWAVLTPEGLFDGSSGGREKVAFRIGKGLDVVPLDRFFQDFYYPGLLAAIWRGGRPMPGKSLRTDPAPTLKMLVQAAGGGKDRVAVDVAVTDQGSGVKGPWLQHNGAVLRAGSKLRQEGKTVHYRFAVALVPGNNRVEVRAATADGGRESEPAVAVVSFDGKLPEPELYVLAIGVNRFARGAGVSNLDYCVPDARAVADLFQKRSGRLFKAVHVTPLYDEQASKEGILKAVAALAGKARAQDTLVLYVASHGIAVGQRFYLIPHDFQLAKGGAVAPRPKEEMAAVAVRGYRGATDEQEAAVRARGLAIDELGEALAAVPALKRVLIFDTCHSGSAIALAGKRQNPFAFRGAMERFGRAQGVYSLAAAAADERAAEDKQLGHSILTYALLAGLGAAEGGPLKGQALKGDGGGGVDVLAWFRYAREQVPALYQRYVGRPQHVELSGDDQPTFPLLALPEK